MPARTFNTTTTDWQAEQKSLESRRKMAEMLQADAQRQAGPGQMVGNVYVGPSWTQGAAQLAKALVAKQQLGDIETESKDLATQRSKALAEALGGMPRMRQETTQQPFDMASVGQDMPDEVPIPGLQNQQTRMVAPTMQDNAQWLGRLGSIGPDAVQMGGTVLGMQQRSDENALNRQNQMEQRAMQLEAIAANQAAARADRQAAAEQAAQLRRDLQQSQQQFAAQQAADQRAFIAANRQPVQPQIIQTDAGPMMLPRGGNQAVPIMGPDGQPVQGKSTEKALPTSAAQKLMENNQNLRRAQQALALIQGQNIIGADGKPVSSGDPKATGIKGYIPEAILQRVDPEGISTRAAIGDLGSLVIHDRSGAAVTASEYPRLRPFIPLVTDDPATVKKKLSRFVQEYENIVNEAADFYRGSGYKVPSETLRGPGTSPALPNAAAIQAEIERRAKVR